MEDMELKKTSSLQEAKEESYKFLSECLKLGKPKRPAEEGSRDSQISQAVQVLLSESDDYTLIDYGVGEGRLIAGLNNLSDKTLQKMTYFGVDINYPSKAEVYSKNIGFSNKVNDIKFMTFNDFDDRKIKAKYIFVINVLHEIQLCELPKRLHSLCNSLENNGLIYINDFIELKEGEHDFVTWDYDDYLTIFDKKYFEIIGKFERSGKSGKYSLITLPIRKINDSIINETYFKNKCLEMYDSKKKRVSANIEKIETENKSYVDTKIFNYLLVLNWNIGKQMEHANKEDWLSKLQNIIPNFEIIDEWIEHQAKNANPEDFYKGNTSLGNIVSGYDVKRSVTYINKITKKKEKWSYNNLFEYLIRKETDTRSGIFSILLTGAAGEGKTTLLFRIGYDLFKLKEEKEFYVLRLRSGYGINSEQLLNFYHYIQKPVYLLIDTIFIKEIVSHLANATYELSLKNIPITFLISARKGEWEIVKGESALHVIKYDEMLLEDLERGEIEEILKHLEKNHLLGKLASLTYEERITIFFEEKAKKQLLVALLELTKGESFERILENEYKNLSDFAPKAAEAYLIVCFLYQYGKLTPEGFLKRFCGYGSASSHFFYKEVINTTPRVIIMAHERGLGNCMRARHPLIASVVIRKVLSKNEKLHLISEIINKVNIGIRGERYIVIKLLRGIISDYQNKNELEENRKFVKDIVTKENSQAIKEIFKAASREDKNIELLEWAWIFNSIEEIDNSIWCLKQSIEISIRNKWNVDPRTYYYYGKALKKYFKKEGKNNSKLITIERIKDCFQKAYQGGLLQSPFLQEYACLEWETAAILEKSRDKKTALENYEHIICINPDHEAAIWKCAYIALELEQPYRQKAINYFRDYLKIHIKKDIAAAMTRVDLAKLLIEKGKDYYNESESLLLEAIDIFPKFPWSYIELGILYKKINRNDDAVKHLLKGETIANEISKLEAVEKAKGMLKEIKQELGNEQFISILMTLISKLI